MNKVIYVSATSLDTLQETVNQKMGEGYVPIGNIVHYEEGTPGTGSYYAGFVQPMMLEIRAGSVPWNQCSHLSLT